MNLENRFSIPVPAVDAWRVLLDLERMAPHVPGVVLIGGDESGCKGKIKVKLGPAGLTYHGVLKILSRNELARVAVPEGEGRARNNGTAKALITCRLIESGNESTTVFVETELVTTDKPAEYSGDVIAAVTETLIAHFAANLAEELVALAPVDLESLMHTELPHWIADGAAPKSDRPTEPVSLLNATVGARVVKRLAPVAVTVTLLIVLQLVRRRPKSSI
ncbi:SRPBCC family protein [Nocardia sp. NBC_01730]|uniref:SRPBCC family protein n=1 Tax=Nocardia sp. NBC_01730 TaxID=2975998 RepID=UPI002E0EC820|nr:SRPBCC family protein [Nocardia sp. NBC_01730]